MFLIQKLPSKEVTSKTGIVKMRSQGLFKCPVCKKEVIKDIDNGRKIETCSKQCRIYPDLKHGMCGTPIHNIWRSMKGRCDSNSVNSINYKYYAGKGITYQESWKEFSNFLTDMIGTFEPGLSLDRIDPNGNYTKENCQWITLEENMRKDQIKPIYKYTQDGVYVCSYESVAEAVLAGEAPFSSSLSRVARGERTHYKGFVWKYEE